MLRGMSLLGWIWFCRMYIPTLNHALGMTLGPCPPAFYTLNALRSGTIHCQRNTVSSPRRVDTVHFGEICPRSFETPGTESKIRAGGHSNLKKEKITCGGLLDIHLQKYGFQSILYRGLCGLICE